MNNMCNVFSLRYVCFLNSDILVLYIDYFSKLSFSKHTSDFIINNLKTLILIFINFKFVVLTLMQTKKCFLT